MMTFQEFKTAKYFGSLDGFRALGILLVIWHHAGGGNTGLLGVTIFFILSGFLITTLLIRESQTGSINLFRFYMRRTLRIFPVYYLVLAVYCVLVALLEQGPEREAFWQNLPAYLTYTSNWFVPLTDGRVIFYFAWSLATEEQYYLVWPWAMKYRRNKVLFGVLAAVVAFISPAILAGAILAFILNTERGFKALGRLFWNPATRLLLDNRPMVEIGKVSYGMYLIHMLCMNVVRKFGLSTYPMFFMTVGLAFAAAWLLFRYYEKPFLSLKKNFSRQ